ncbi:hypothetical protein NSA47_07295 [Irregularibacter muris]|uniref:Uncharacterized protein n=1 Tax=Irregularibacter muris TaxID=1796619 RepID=A0AAE3KZU7_9FIRM|nr:hypothetical protein [Irregularibacter muris]MCR1898787.1 hypothetical protein [Irregularibacter muris]
MGKKRKLCILRTMVGGLSTLIGVVFLFIKITRQYIPALEPHSFRLFMISPVFMTLGIKMLCKDIKKRTVNVFSDVLLGLAIIYLVILSAGWVTINIM